MQPAVFLDRDDTLIEDMGYTADLDRVQLKRGTSDALRRLRDAGYSVVVVTNQSGIARGHFTEAELAQVHERMQELLRRGGAGVDAVYYCPFLPGAEAVVEQYRRESNLRKPRPGMLLQASRELNLDLRRSWMIGDALRDVEAGRAAGCRTILIANGAVIPPGAADFTAPDMPTAVDIIVDPSAARPSGATGDRAAGNAPPNAPLGGDRPLHSSTDGLLRDLISEVRQWRRELRGRHVSAAHLLGYLFQVAALAAAGWAAYGMVERGAGPEPAAQNPSNEVRLLSAIGLQLVAMTCLRPIR